MISLNIPIAPIPTPRPRIAVRGRFASAYYPKSYKEWKEEVGRLLTGMNAPDRINTSPCKVQVVFCCHKPKTTKRQTPKGDIDNYVKAVLDAITKDGRFWKDDDQVYVLHTKKVFCDPITGPEIFVKILFDDQK